ncbi:hypothetical protein B0H11DRAFT_2224097 [Mycena galericulata]|nr:hypothetical protein B0H11DRAFT_2237719 [Mycena galericulata]KAJ7501739.1 hypothetical protein B0H11DRAFT_2224097 [Mycena galericulata]
MPKETFLDMLIIFPMLAHFSFGIVSGLGEGSDADATFDFETKASTPSSSSPSQISTRWNLPHPWIWTMHFHSSCTIDQLVKSFVGDSPEVVVLWLEALPSLVVLELNFCPDIQVSLLNYISSGDRTRTGLFLRHVYFNGTPTSVIIFRRNPGY